MRWLERSHLVRRFGVFAALLLALGLGQGPGVSRALQTAPGPIVVFTSPTPGDVLRGQVAIRGWAVDPEFTPGSGNGINPSDVQLWLEPFPAGQRLDYARYGEPSPESQQRFDARFLTSGFLAEWETCSFPPGPVELWAYVSSIGRPGVLGYANLPVTVAPCPPRSELYRANFGDREAWPALSTARIETLPDGDGWRINQATSGGVSQGPPAVFANFRAEVTARIIGPETDRYYYLQFRQEAGPGDTRSDGFYRFTVDPSFASYDLARWDADSEEMLVEETRRPELVRPANQENRLAVLAEGPRIRVYVNDVEVGDVTDATYPWGRVSFGVGSNLQPSAQAHFRDFVITTP